MENKIEGRNAVLEALRAGKPIDKLYVLDGCPDGPVRTIIREAKKGDTIINYVKKERLDQLSETGHHQGVIAMAASYEYATVEDILEKDSAASQQIPGVPERPVATSNLENEDVLEISEKMYLTQIHEFKGLHSNVGSQKEILAELVEIAKIQSIEASNRIEGIITTDDRLKLIVKEKTMPMTRSEKEISGYRDVLATIHESYEYIPIRSNMILQLHRDLYKFSGSSVGGYFKTTDNVITEELLDGTRRVRFEPVPS